jgi:hypothetical protein
MKNIAEILRDLFVPRTWKIIDKREIASENDAKWSGGTIYTLQDQYGNLKRKKVTAI